MLKKLLLTSIAVFMVTSQSFAENFYNAPQTGVWDVFGSTGNDSQNPACIAETVWEDGSKMQLIKDLASGEIYIWFQDYAWDIADEVGKEYPVRINMYKDNQVVGGDFNYTLITKNTIAIRALDYKTFLPAFMEMTEMRLLMPGSIGNAIIPLTGSTAAIEKMVECIEASKKPATNAPETTAPKLGQDT